MNLRYMCMEGKDEVPAPGGEQPFHHEPEEWATQALTYHTKKSQQLSKLRYPSVAKLRTQYLPIPATSVPSERAFSVAGEVVSVRRERLLPDHVEQLIFLHDNM
ncbi:hypothetical protein MRX96_002295 [Rhipicephalus microplus]